MATLKEVEGLLRKAKKELRETRTHNQFLLDRLEKAHERNAEIRKQMMTMTFDDVLKTQKELAEYQAKFKKDQELIETFDKQAQVKLNSKLNGETSRQDQQVR
jgi:hypothetical protein